MAFSLKNPMPSSSFLSSKTLTRRSQSPLLSTIKNIETRLRSFSLSASPIPLTLKSRLAAGESLYGIFLLSFSPTMAEIAAHAGYDFAVVDLEHGSGDISTALPVLRALEAAMVPAIVRVPEANAVWAKKVLDLGPQGIMFPMVDTPDEAAAAVSYCRYPPRGVRGAAHPVVRASKYGIDDAYLSRYEDELLIMCQVENEEAAHKAGEIASVEGVDCVQMGPLDLSASMGYLWDPRNKKVREVLHRAEHAVLDQRKEGGAYLAGFAVGNDTGERLRERGYNMISGAVDVGLFRDAVVEDVRSFKASSGNEISIEEDEDKKYWSE